MNNVERKYREFKEGKRQKPFGKEEHKEAQEGKSVIKQGVLKTEVFDIRFFPLNLNTFNFSTGDLQIMPSGRFIKLYKQFRDDTRLDDTNLREKMLAMIQTDVDDFISKLKERYKDWEGLLIKEMEKF